MIKFQSQYQPDLKLAREKFTELCADHPMTGWLTLPYDFDSAELDRIKSTAQQIRQKYQYLVCIGIGGSYLGHRALIDAIAPTSNPTKVLYAGNSLSPRALQQVLDEVGDADFAVNVISKSGTTTEPAIAFRIFREKLIKKYGEKSASQHIFVTTDQAKGALHDEAVAKGYTSFVVPDDVGGRYSVLTPVGLLPLAVAGIDVDALLAGAREEADAVKDDQNSSALTYATVRYQLSADYHTEVLATMEPSLRYFEYWWEQLFGESEGKNYQGIFPTSLVYTTDLHSMGQYLQQGKRTIFETFLRFDRDDSESILIPECADDSDGLGYLVGKDLAYVNNEAAEATITAHQSGENGLPVLQIIAPDFSAKSFGALVYFFETACAVSAKMAGVNPFDQPGVEAYKTEMFRRLGKPGF